MPSFPNKMRLVANLVFFISGSHILGSAPMEVQAHSPEFPGCSGSMEFKVIEDKVS